MSKVNYFIIITIALVIGTMGLKTYESINNLQKNMGKNMNELSYALNNSTLMGEENNQSIDTTDNFSNLELED